jgi:prevent-host-death family protein
VAREISQRELRNESGKIMRALDRGEEFVVTRNGTPVAELLPLRRRRFVPRAIAIAAFAGAPGVDLQELRDDLDAVADPDASPRV